MQIITAENRERHIDLLGAMFADRKRVFVDRLKWDVPVVDGRLEVDQYDTDDTIYIIEHDGAGRHLASMRFLPTTKPHLLRDLFPFLSVDPVPIGEDIWEVGRGCFSPELSAQDFEIVSARLSAGMMECAVLHGVKTLIMFAPVQALSRALAWGWELTPLGPPRDCGAGLLGAFSMPISADVVRRFREKVGLTSPVVKLEMHRAA